jgi:signal transduction histidine kinase
MSSSKLYFAKAVAFQLLLALFFISISVANDNPFSGKTIKVGLWNNNPLVYRDAKGRAKGLFPTIVDYVATEEGWDVEYVYGAFGVHMQSLKNGELDILLSTSLTAERKETYIFNKENIFSNWGVILVPQESQISSMLNLEGKHLAVMDRAVYTDSKGGIRDLIKDFNINAKISPKNTYQEAIETVVKGDAQGAVVNRIVAERLAEKFGLKQSGIVFKPVETRMAFLKNKPSARYLAQTIDKHLVELKDDPNSLFHAALDVAQGGKIMRENKYIQFILFGLGLMVVVAFALFIWSRMLRSAVTKATRKLKLMNVSLEKRNKELDEFTFVASHDLQEPLRKITTFSSMLKLDLGDDLSVDAEENLAFVTDAAKRMQTLVDDLLLLSRSGRRELNKATISLNQCVDTALDSLSTLVEENNAEIIKIVLPEVYGDRTLITQLYQNLIGNAIKFHRKDSSPVVTLTVESSAAGTVFGVADNGIGIAEKYHAQVFSPFKRLHGKDTYKGTGIGLAICRKAVERHNGKIWIETSPEGGAYFKFTLGDKE